MARNRLSVVLAAAASCASAAVSSAAADEFYVDFDSGATNGNLEASLLNDELVVGADGIIVTIGDGENAILGTSGNIVLQEGNIGTTGVGATAILMQGGSNQVENDGAIMTTGANSMMINLIGDDNSFVNTGTMISEASGGIAVRLYGNDGEVHNEGLIQTAGANAYGIRTGLDGNVVVNSGVIETSGTNAFGMFLSGTDQQIDNTGSITTTGSGATAILANGTGFEIFNSGTLQVSGANASGVRISENSSFENSGTVIATGASGTGVYAEGTSTVENSGWIEAQGTSAHALHINTSGLVVNSGVLISRQGSAIEFSGAERQLTLEMPSFLIGQITLSGTMSAEGIEVVTGAYHSLFWQLTGGLDDTAPVLSGSVPAVYSTSLGAIMTFDPTLLGFGFVGTNALSGAVLGLAASRLDLAPDSSLVSAHGAGSKGRASGTGTAWIAGFDWNDTLDGTGTFLPVDLAWQGVAGGMDWHDGEHAFGFMIGGARSAATAHGPYSDSADASGKGVLAAVYGRLRADPLTYDLSLAGGWNRYSQARNINDNLSETGWAQASARYSGWWLAPELAVGLPVSFAEGWTLVPALRNRNLLQWQDGYTETGTDAAARVDASMQASVEFRAEVAIKGKFRLAGIDTALGLRGGVSYTSIFGDDTAQVWLDDTALSLPRPTHDTGLAGFAGLSAGMRFGSAGRLFVSAEGRIRETGFHGVTAAIGLEHRF